MATAETLTDRDALRIGVVCFLNTTPLIDGLDGLSDLELQFSVPSLLLDQLVGGEVDMALCSSIDYQRSPVPLIVVPAGLLGCDGATLTVRLYSSTPIAETKRIHCDTDSHTSIALLQIVLRERFGLTPEIIPYDAREHVAENRPLAWPPAMMLIGDKVVTDSPPAVRYPYQLDLGAEWKTLTGLPFVFATWMARRGDDPSGVARAARILDRQLRYNQLHLEPIVARAAETHRWPRDLASSYLRERLDFSFDERHRDGLELFFQKSLEHGLIHEARPLEYLTD